MFSTTRQNYQKYKINQLFGDVKPNKSRAPENEIFFYDRTQIDVQNTILDVGL